MALLGLTVKEDACLRARGHGGYVGVVPVEYGRAVWGQGVHQLRLGGGDSADRAQPLQVHGAHVGDDADPGPGDAAEKVDLAGAVHRHLQDGALVFSS